MGEEVKDKKEATVNLVENAMGDEASLLTDQKNGKKGGWQLLLGITFIQVSLILLFTNTGGIPVFVTGYLFLAHGLLLRYPAQEKYQLHVTFNGHQYNEMTLRKIALCTANIIVGMTGIVITLLMTNGLFWIILGLGLCILIIIVTIQAIFDICYRNPTETRLDNVYDIIDNSASRKHFNDFVNTIGRTMPLATNDRPAKFSRNPVYIFFIVIAMIVCMAIFSAQIWNINLDDNPVKDPENLFARYYTNGPLGIFHRYDRMWFITISSVITFILGITMIALLMRTTQMRLFLFCVLAFGIGVVFILFSTYTIQYIILMGACLPPYTSCEIILVNLSIFFCIPILGSLFMALSYSSIIQMSGDQNSDKSTTKKKRLVCISTIISILVILLSSATMITTNVVTMKTVQKHWNTTEDHKWSRECRDDHDDSYRNNYQRYDYQHEYNEYGTASTANKTPKIKPEKCYGQELDFEYQSFVFAFSISHLSHIESLLFLSFFVLLTGKKITKDSLFLPGLFLFVSVLLTTTFGVFLKSAKYVTDYSLQSLLQNPFFIMNCFSIGTAFVTGIVCLFVGNGILISFIALIFKIILAITVLVINVLYIAFGGILKASEAFTFIPLEKRDLEENKLGNKQEIIESTESQHLDI